MLARMVRSLAHRGPDDEGIFHDPEAGVALGHRRLSILDLSPRGHQPMISRRGLALSYNGEIYNFHEVRNSLQKEGHHFESDCDTEVLLAAWEQWGEAALDRIEGMYAFAMWSPVDQSLTLVRDPLGIKPLYWMQLAGGIAFASELRAFKELNLSLAIDESALVEYVDLGYVFDRHCSAIAGIEKVPPASLIRFRQGARVAERQYWSLPPTESARSERPDESIDALSSVLENVISQHLIADVPVGILLSGGLDSSLIAAYAARERKVTTITMSFGRSQVDESRFANQVAASIGSEQIDIQLSPEDVTSALESGGDVIDDLFADWGVVSTRLLYQRSRELGMKVVLVGEGSDEVFGGYAPYHFAAQRRDTLASRFALYRMYSGKRYGRGYFAFARALDASEGEPHANLFEKVRRFELRRQLPNNYVMKVDRASMSASVEARTPFLDRRVADLALRFPSSLLLRGGAGKWILREVARRQSHLPKEIIERPKFGGSIATLWLDEDEHFAAYARSLILRPGSWSERLGYRDAMSRYFDRRQTGFGFPRSISIFRNLAWRLLTLEIWAKNLGVAA